MRLAVVMPSLSGGGIERMRLHLIDEFRCSGVEVDLVLGRRSGAFSHLVPEGVNVYEVAGRSNLLFPLGLTRYINNRRPTHILATPADVAAICLCSKWISSADSKVVFSVHNHLTTQNIQHGICKKLKNTIVLLLLRRLRRSLGGVIAVSEGVAADVAGQLKLPARDISVIYNPVINVGSATRLDQVIENICVPIDVPWILYVGRFVKQKGVDVLLKAFAVLSKELPSRLVLMGSGPLEQKLCILSDELGIASRVHFVGFRDNPYPWMKQAALLVLPSIHEGLGNVLVEAMFCGTQVVATDCPSGPSEILDNGRYGQLVAVRSVNELHDAMKLSLTRQFWIDPSELKARALDFASDIAAARYLEVCNTGKVSTS